MDNKVRRWCSGYIYVEIKGKDKERFINLCTNKGLHIYDLEKNADRFCFCIEVDEYKKTKKIIRKTHIMPKILEKKGLPFAYAKLRHRQSLVVGIMLGLFIFYMCSLFVWDIDIRGENYYTDYELIRFLKERKIKPGVRVKDLVCKDIEDMIRNTYNDIGWVSAQIKGTRLIITLKENVKFTRKKNDEGSKHIIATRDGIIKKLVVRDGEPLVSIGDKVEKGDVIVSGIMEIVDDAKTVVGKKEICADADINIEYDIEYYEQIKRKYEKKVYTNKKSNQVQFLIGNDDLITLFTISSLKKFDNFDVIVNNYNVSLGKDVDLPFVIIRSHIREYKLIKDKYTDNELKKIAKEEFFAYCNELNDKNMTIINSDIAYYLTRNMIVSKGVITLQSSDVDYKDIDKEELEVKVLQDEIQN